MKVLPARRRPQAVGRLAVVGLGEDGDPADVLVVLVRFARLPCEGMAERFVIRVGSCRAFAP